MATHIDSWENGSQNWTAKMREEFQKRRGYDMLPFLPVMTGRVVDSLEISERFLWDLRQTISELVVENYAGRMRELAQAARDAVHRGGLRRSLRLHSLRGRVRRADGRVLDARAARWRPARAWPPPGTSMANESSARSPSPRATRRNGASIPATLKALGDTAFCEGINRFVFHRYAMQPWAQDRRPGMTMGPWGQHYERTETWWEESPAWHRIPGPLPVSCCGRGCSSPTSATCSRRCPRKASAATRARAMIGTNAEPEVVLNRMSVKNGRIVLPDGMSYRLLVLPQASTATPALLRRVRELVQAGATVMGSPA